MECMNQLCRNPWQFLESSHYLGDRAILLTASIHSQYYEQSTDPQVHVPRFNVPRFTSSHMTTSARGRAWAKEKSACLCGVSPLILNR